MNSIYLILLLLCCCNHSCESACGCDNDRRGAGGCKDSLTGGYGSAKDCGKHHHDHERGCGCPGENARRDENPFSPFDRDGEYREEKYPEFRGNKGPCGCEDLSE